MPLHPPRKPPGPPLVPLLYPPHGYPTPHLKDIAPRPSVFPESNPFADLSSKTEAATAKNDNWRVKLHIFPAAYPRSRVGSALTKGSEGHREPLFLSDSRLSDQEVAAKVEEVLDNQEFSKPVDIKGTKYLEEYGFWVAANRYVPDNPHKDGVTLVFTHANGLNKEMWEPTIAEILSRPDCPLIYDIWTLDNVMQGDSAIINRNYFGNVYDWADYGRDILQFLLRYLPSAENEPQPTELIRQSLENDKAELLDESEQTIESLRNGNRSWRGRRIVTIGHSFGATGVIHAASSIPSILSGVILFDPVIDNGEYARSRARLSVQKAVQRRDNWPSIDEARKAFMKNQSFFGRWRPDVLERYLHFGLCAAPRKTESEKDHVMLKTPKENEQIVFAEVRGREKAYNRLSLIPLDLPIHWAVPEKGSVTRDWVIRQGVQQAPHATFVTLLKGGHMLPMDNPKGCADEIVVQLKKNSPLRAKN